MTSEQQYRYYKLKAFAERLETNNNQSYNLTAEEATWLREIIIERLDKETNPKNNN